MTSQQFDAVIVGAGFGGIGAAIQLKRIGYDNFVILEREDDLGGTWHVNRYPGLAVDVPSTTYSYFFEPNPNWSRLFAPGAELKRYADDVADKYDVRRHMRFNTTVEGARWDEDTSSGGRAGRRRDADHPLPDHRHRLPVPAEHARHPGHHRFAGKVIHTTAWDDDYDLETAGSPSSAPAPPRSSSSRARQEGRRPHRVPAHRRSGWCPRSTCASRERAKRLFARVPLTQRAIRWRDRRHLRVIIYVGVHHRYLRRLNVAASDLAKMHRFATIRDKELRASSRRTTTSVQATDVLQRLLPHLHQTARAPADHGIERIEPDGIVTVDGTKTAIDTLVLATGFDLWEANFPAIEIIGRDGRNLGKWWRDTRFQAYQGVSVPYFPNYLSLASPYAFLGLYFFNTMEYQMRHMDRLFGEVNRRGATTFEVTEEANARFLDRMTELLGDSVWTIGNCATSRSYYFNPSGEATLLRPMSTRTAIKEASEFPLSDYQIA